MSRLVTGAGWRQCRPRAISEPAAGVGSARPHARGAGVRRRDSGIADHPAWNSSVPVKGGRWVLYRALEPPAPLRSARSDSMANFDVERTDDLIWCPTEIPSSSDGKPGWHAPRDSRATGSAGFATI